MYYGVRPTYLVENKKVNWKKPPFSALRVRFWRQKAVFRTYKRRDSIDRTLSKKYNFYAKTHHID
jgi:hypothetical protein